MNIYKMILEKSNETCNSVVVIKIPANNPEKWYVVTLAKRKYRTGLSKKNHINEITTQLIEHQIYTNILCNFMKKTDMKDILKKTK